MEKFTKWRDKKTGIHPFLPLKARPAVGGEAVWRPVKLYLIGPLLLLLRLPLLAIVYGWLNVMDAVASLIPVAPVRRLFRRYTQFLGCRTMLALMGFYSVTIRGKSLRRGVKLAPGDCEYGSPVASGDVVLCNYTSYVDLLYAGFRFAPKVAVAPSLWQFGGDAPCGVLCVSDSVVSFYRKRFSETGGGVAADDDAQCSSAAQVIDSLGARKDGPLLLFAEGARSTGRMVLEFQDALDGADLAKSKCRVHVMHIRYPFQHFSPTFSVGSSFKHVCRLLMEPVNYMEVNYISKKEMPKPYGTSAEYMQALNSAVAAIGGVPVSSANALDKTMFLLKWHGRDEELKALRKKAL